MFYVDFFFVYCNTFYIRNAWAWAWAYMINAFICNEEQTWNLSYKYFFSVGSCIDMDLHRERVINVFHSSAHAKFITQPHLLQYINYYITTHYTYASPSNEINKDNLYYHVMHRIFVKFLIYRKKNLWFIF